MRCYVSKKVGVVCLCFFSVLAGVFIGRNVNLGTPTFQNALSTEAKPDDAREVGGGATGGTGRRIQNKADQLKLDTLRKGGVFTDNVRDDKETKLQNDDFEDDEEDYPSETGPGRPFKEAIAALPHQNAVNAAIEVVRNILPGVGGEESAKNRDVKSFRDPYAVGEWNLAGDPRLPRLLRKILEKMPANIKQDIPREYRQFNMRQARDTKLMYKQWQVVVEVLKNHGMEQRLPDCISIGVKKSGTNAVGFFLTQHPQIAHSVGNEVHFFDKNYEKGLDYYRVRMGFAIQGQISFEKTPKYFVTEDAPEHIANDLPKNIKFIISVRNPVDRALSDFRHESELKLRREQRNKIRLKDRDLGGRTAEGEGKIFEEMVLDKHGNVNASNEILDTSYYAKHFKRWLKYFPRDRFMIIDLETLEKGAFPKLKELEQFLGLKDYFHENMFYYDKARHGTCMRNKARPCPAKSTPGVLPKAKISDATLKKLHDFYRPSNKEFMQLTGQDFTWAHL